MNPVLSSIQQAYAEALSGMDAASTQLHPFGDAAQWNTQQLVEHLILTYQSTARVLNERLEKGRPTQAPVTHQHQVLRERYLSAGRFPKGQQAPEPVRPGQETLPHLSGKELAERLRQGLEMVDHLLDECSDCFGEQQVASHFAFGPLTAEQWRQFHAAHAQHHLTQLALIRGNIDKNLTVNEKTASTT